ncbi:MAG TPA: ABC transporter ATP-binding protein [Longimicrobium sp.]
MANARLLDPSRWRALLDLMWRAGRWKLVLFGALVIMAGLLPTAVMLVTGSLVAAIPGAVEHGLDAAAGRPALFALGGLLLALGALSICANAMVQLARVLDAAFALEVHHTVAMVTLGTPGLAPLEDPSFADALQPVREAERRGVLRRTAFEISNIGSTRLRGIGAFVVLLAFSWWAPLVLTFAWWLTNRVYVKSTEKGVSVGMNEGAVRQRRAEYLRSLAMEPAAAKEVRVFGIGGWTVARYGEAWKGALGLVWEGRKASRPLTAAATVALAVSHGVVLAALGLAVSRGEMSAAALLVYVQAVLATSDLGVMGESQWFLAQSLAVSERVAQLRAMAPDRPDRVDPATVHARRVKPPVRLEGVRIAPVPAPARGSVAVRLQDVRFTYRGREKPTLDGLTLDIPAGQSLAIVGENGAGKSTLIKLLCGLYEPDGGRITLDGAASPLQARDRIGVIFQDFVRYPLALRENVGFGNLGLMADDAALEKAMRDAGAGELLGKLANGWDTVLSKEFEGGADLSGGQWQRVALARALTAVRGGAGLLILDEPTAALDVRAETDLFERFLELTRDVTTILVSHRLSSVRHADRIVVIDGGRLVEDGTHDALMAAGGIYARMFTLQAERFAAQPANEGVEVADA